MHLVKEVLEEGKEPISDELRQLLNEWVEQRFDGDASQQLSYKILPLLDAEAKGRMHYVYNLRHHFVKPSQWIIGGDGWAYDIGFGGLDHVLASGKNVNVLVLDTEVYSNTGGQSSKSTPLGAIAKFAASGKRVRKKDLGLIATTYGYVYVAQIAMGANPAQTLKVLREAEAYEGPSLVIAYSPCISHGLKGGMGNAQNEQKRAVDCVTGTSGTTTHVVSRRARTPSYSTARSLTSRSSRTSSRARYATLHSSRCTQRSLRS